MDRKTPKKSVKARKTISKTKSTKKEGAKDDPWTDTYLRSQMKGTELNLSQKLLEEIPPAVFRIKEVEILDVSDNPVISIQPDIASLSNLKELKAAGCPIADVSGAISMCAHLSKMDFSRNPLISTLPETMMRLRYLTCVAISDCKLKSLPDNLTHLSTVETLDLSKNELTTLPAEISGLRQLKVLILNNNAFESIPESIVSLGCLENLEMKQNKLKNRQRDLQLNVPRKLMILDMEDNSSLCFLPAGLEKIEHIEKLNLSYCGIETIPDSIGQSSSLKEIYLAGNKLRTLPDTFGRLVNLETLNLEGNRRLYGLPPALHHLQKLKDKKIGKNTGLVLNDTPALQLPDHNIVREGVVSVRTDLLAEDCFNSILATIGMEIIDEVIIEDLSENVTEVVQECICDITIDEVVTIEHGCVEDVFRYISEDVTLTLVNEISKETVDAEGAFLDAVALLATEELLQEISDGTVKIVALEHDEEWRLGQTVPDEYDKEISCQVSTVTSNIQSLDLQAGCNLSIPPGATDEDTSVISAVLNPHGYDGKLQLKDTELLVSDIIEMRPSGMTFSEPVKLKIPHSLPKFDCEREYIVMTSEDDGRTWAPLKALSEQEHGQRSVTVEIMHFTSFAVVARPLEHCNRVGKGEASTLTSSEQTGIEISLPEDCIPDEKEISFTVTPVDRDTLSCAGIEDSVDNMSHIVNFFKGSNLLLNNPATVVLPLSPGEENSKVRVLSRNESGEWEDVTNKVEDVVLQGSKVAFKTDRLSSGFVVLRCRDGTDVSGIVNLVTRNVRARRVRTVIFKKWKEPREDGFMTARMECVLEESVEDRICRTTVKDKYELQEGTPTPPVIMLESETVCAIFHGNIRPEVEMVNGMYGVNFKFYCERTRKLEFDVKVLDWGKDSFSMVELYPGPRENYHLMSAWEIAEPAAPLAVAGITKPRGPNCPYWLACQRFKNTLGIDGTYFSPDHDKCYCETCHRDRGDPDSSQRGEPEKKSAVPVGWARFGLSLNPAFNDEDLNVFSKWHRAYHGTKHYSVKKILQGSSILLMPGDVALGGFELRVREGHITPDDDCPDGFDPEQVFVSPSIVYAGLDVYASPERFDDDHEGKAYNARVAFQLCIRPDSYEVGPQTVGAGRRPIDPLFSNDELEWFTKEKGGQALYGLLVKLEDV